MCTLGASLGGSHFPVILWAEGYQGMFFFSYRESSNELPIMDLEQLSTLYQSSFLSLPHIFFLPNVLKQIPGHQVTHSQTSYSSLVDDN